MTTVAATLVPEVAVERETLAQRMHDGYLEAALFSLEQLEGAAREADLLDARGSVLNYERVAAIRDTLKVDAERYEGMAQLLRDKELAK